MTGRLERRNHGRGAHSYKIDGRKAVGVTTVLQKAVAKPALINWAGRTTAEYALDHWDHLATLSPSARLKELVGAKNVKKTGAAERGKEVHRFAERIANGEAIPDKVIGDLLGSVRTFTDWLDEWDVEPVATETPLANITYGYAGTADLWARVPRLGYVLLDIKTGGVYDEVSLQLAAYRNAEVWQPEKGIEEPLPPVDACYVVQVHPDSVRLFPVSAGQAEFATFLYALGVARWVDDCKEASPVSAALNLNDPEGNQ